MISSTRSSKPGAGDDTLAGGIGDDTYRFTDGWGTDTVIEEAGTEGSEANAGVDTLDFSGVSADLVFTIGADGGLSVSDSTNTVTAVGVENLIGGSGLNTLDYSAYTSGVSVDLEQGFASLFESVVGIDNVIGTALGDILIGDSGVNLLQGGAGGDFISGGGGADDPARGALVWIYWCIRRTRT